MRALSLTQPWASLVVLGAKEYETRSWATAHRGPLVIHAAKSFPTTAKLLCCREPFKTALGHDARWEPNLPIGAFLGLVWLQDCLPTELVRDTISPTERAFGGYEAGRWAWKLSRPLRFATPIPGRGRLSTFAVPADAEAAIRAALTPEWQALLQGHEDAILAQVKAIAEGGAA